MMHRNHFSFSNGKKSYPGGGLLIEPHGSGSLDPPSSSLLTFATSSRFQPRSQAQMRRRRALRTLAIAAVFFLAVSLFFPDFRATALSALSLGLLSGEPRIQLETVRYYDLSDVQGTARGWERGERILICAPLRDAAPHLPVFFSHLHNFTYPHHLIDLAFLVSDSKDNTLELLSELLEALQADPDPQQPYGEVSIIEKDFGQKVNQDVESRHGFAAQASRRKLMAQARNWLLSSALRPYHSWVYWRDVDLETAPFTILEDLMRHNKDVIVPNVWRPLPDWLGGEQPYDLNSWQESETALALADTLDEDAVIVEGYAEYATWRPHLAYLRDPYGDPDMEMEIDGVGGVSILAKAKVFRSGVHFPAFSYEKHAETEGFGKMARRMQFSVVGLPHYTVWHLYEPSVDDLQHMEEMEQERKQREREEKERAERAQKIKSEFSDSDSQWSKDKEELEGLAKEDDAKALAKEDDAKAQAKGDAAGPKSPPKDSTDRELHDKEDAEEVLHRYNGDLNQALQEQDFRDQIVKAWKTDEGDSDAEDIGDSENRKSSKARKDAKDITDAKDIKDAKAVKEAKGVKDAKDIKDAKGVKDAKDIKDAKDVKDVRDTKNDKLDE